MRTVRGSGCTLVWSADERTIEKRYDRLSWSHYGYRHEPWTTEWRVGSLLRRQPPPVAHARLLAADRRRRALTFEAVDGQPLGPKFPLELSAADVEDLAALAIALPAYRPEGLRGRRFAFERRIRWALELAGLPPPVADELRRQYRQDPPTFVFGHGDITARNVLRSASTGQAVLIDWEWAARYPRGWDLAFLWFTLVDAPGARRQVEALVPERDVPWFWRSALLVQLLHLTLWGLRPDSPFRPKHERMRDELVERVLTLG
ncbi:MAG TPA: phosphotransferase [Acidimicrobiales bacterium]|nr:phosphotransferase [Acidimicrobiales bacterium]